MGNPLKLPQAEYDAPVQQFPSELQVGRKWRAAQKLTRGGETSSFYYDFKIVRRETITVPAGTFDTFFIDGVGFNQNYGSRLEARFWLVPGVNFFIRREQVVTNQRGGKIRTERHELVAVRQYVRGKIT